MKDGLFHKDLGFPPNVDWLEGRTFNLRYSRHAKTACMSDRYGFIKPPGLLTFRRDLLVEVELFGGWVIKAVVRVAYDDTYDLVLVVMPERYGEALVKTCRLNRKDDPHNTLDRSKYQTYIVS
jgi:hypothetical protein